MSEIRTDTINNASGDNDSGIDLSTNDQVGIKTANTTAVTVDASQNVGIGESSPSSTLVVGGNATTTAKPTVAITDTTSGATMAMRGQSPKIAFDVTSSGVPKILMDNAGLEFKTGTLDAEGDVDVKIDSSGNLLVGTTSTTPNPGVVLKPNGIVGIGNSDGSSGNSFIEFRRNATQIGSVTQNGTTGVSYNTSSDHRLKENVTADWDATTRLKQLNPVRFNFIADADTTVDGFLAHEVQSVVPEAITGTHNEVDDDGNPVYQGIDQSKLVPLLVKTIQELEARIEALENA